MRDVTLAANEVAIWQIDLVGGKERLADCRRLLSQDEIARADRFYFERDRRCFTLARAAMRQILSCYTGLPPEELVFSYSPTGKPELSGKAKDSGFTFNLAHSSERGLLAVSQGMTVGADIESVNAEFATEEIAKCFFSTAELRILRSLPASEKVEAFFSCWTRKEAYAKALGCGLMVPLNQFTVAFRPGVPAALLNVAQDLDEVSRWKMYDVSVANGYRAAVVVEGEARLRSLTATKPLLAAMHSEFARP